MNEISANHALTITNEQSTWREYPWDLAALILLYVVLAFFRLGSQSFWADEVASVDSMFPRGSAWSDWFRLSPVYFVLLGLWSELFDVTESSARAFSAVLGLGCVCMTYVIGYKLSGRRTAIIAAFLLATSPYLIWYAQEARFYTLMILTSLIMTYSFARATDEDSWKWWGIYTLSSLLALFSFVTVVFLIAAHALYVLCCTSHRDILVRVALCQAVACIVFAVWLVAHTGVAMAGVVTPPAETAELLGGRSPHLRTAIDWVGIIPYTFYAFSVGFSLGPSLKELHVSRSIESLMPHAPIVASTAILFTLVFLLGFNQSHKTKHHGLFLCLWLMVPIALAYIVPTFTTFREYNTRYVAMSLPAYHIILAAGINSISDRVIRLGLLSTVLLVNGLSLANYYFNPEYARENARAAVDYLESVIEPGEIIVLNGNHEAFSYYYTSEVPTISASLLREQNFSYITDHVLTGKDTANRVWLVESRTWESDPKGEVRAIFDQLGYREKHKSFTGVEVYAYRTNKTPE